MNVFRTCSSRRKEAQNIVQFEPRHLGSYILMGGLALLTGCSTPTPNTRQSSSTTPCMDALYKFTEPDVPALGPDEKPVKPRKAYTNAPPADLPGHGLAQHPMLYVGEGYNKMFLINHGKILCERLRLRRHQLGSGG